MSRWCKSTSKCGAKNAREIDGMAEFKIDANGVKLKKVRWHTKRRKGKTRMWKSKWIPVTLGANSGSESTTGAASKPAAIPTKPMGSEKPVKVAPKAEKVAMDKPAGDKGGEKAVKPAAAAKPTAAAKPAAAPKPAKKPEAKA